MIDFIAELKKLAGDEPETRFQRVVHHPLVQGLGYGALAGEGAHALAERGAFGERAKAWAHRPTGKALGTGTIGASAAFLGAEGAAALQNLFRKKTPSGIEKTSARTRVIEKPVPWTRQLALQAAGGGISAGIGAVAAWQVNRMLNRANKKKEDAEARRRLKAITAIAKESRTPVIVHV